MKKKRLDEILIERGIVKGKAEAFIRVTEGDIFVGGRKAVSPAELYLQEAILKVREPRKYVGRGGYKLEGAFEKFDLNVEGKVCADIGAAIGGFTEVLLNHGAKKVYAIDTARGKLALKLREDPRIVVMEETNLLYLVSLPEPIEFVTCDVSFTSLRYILLSVKKFLASTAEGVFLFKPQYEVDLREIHHGIVTDAEIRKTALHKFLNWAKLQGWEVAGSAESPIRGAKGNVEYLVHFRYTVN
ncbi:MAG: TlyA family RNA methyltransferase [Candidatus Sungbacteria bacterium]|uniref:TlyA family RNA methyltransferase n=1 Tax=Candidatus Sungiibacteriota bacterium TaxID=2750080 RepID=A0A9D6QYZ7_9BACT|nr:TlyA family RNA methyltransferase [Candidatus Sungbacteria bacterium]